MSITGSRLLRNANQACEANPFHNGLHPQSGVTPRLELAGKIESPGQTRSSMSWSSDGRYLATSTGEDVSVWRLPGRGLHYTNKIAMSEDEEKIQVRWNGLQVDCFSW
jgi:hypothetical protein